MRTPARTSPLRPRRAGTIRRLALVALAVGAVAVVSAGPALAQSGDPAPNLRERISERRIGVGNVFLQEGESIDTAVVAIDGSAFVDGSTSDGVLVVSGDAIITGSVGSSVVVIDGNARISGRVGDDVVVLRGRAIIEDGAVVKGDVQSSREPRVASGARVGGETKTIDITGMFTALGFTLLGLFWLAVTVSTAILGLVLLALFGRPFDTAAATARTSTGASIGWGVLLWIALPAISVIAAITLVGIPLGAGTAGALGILGSFGYVTSSLFLGRLMIKAPRNIFGAFFAGWAILRLLALLPGIGMLVWAAAAIFGVGALAVTAWRASRGKYVPPDVEGSPATPAPEDSDTGAIESSDPADSSNDATESTDATTEPSDAEADTGTTKTATATKAEPAEGDDKA
jgi:hypothetical protein